MSGAVSPASEAASPASIETVAWDRGLRIGIMLALIQGVFLTGLGIAAVHLGPREPFVGAWQELVNRGAGLVAKIESTWQRWDALWYQHIAIAGYAPSDGSTAFYPLYPMLARIVSLPSGNVIRAELVVSAIACIVALWLLWQLTCLEVNRQPQVIQSGGADRRGPILAPALTVLVTALFPTGFFLLAPYTEGLFLCLSVGSFWLMRTGRIWSAGALGFMAGLTRAQGALLALPLAYEYARSSGALDWILRRGGRRPGLAALAPLLPVAGVVVFGVYQVTLAGRVGTASLSPWGFTVVPPWEAIQASLDYITRKLGDEESIVEIVNLVSLGAMFAIALVAIRRLPLAYSIYAISTLGLYFFRTMAFSPLMSVSRYVLVVFPCYMVAAMWLSRRPRLAIAWIVVSVAIQLALFQYWVRWGFVA